MADQGRTPTEKSTPLMCRIAIVPECVVFGTDTLESVGSAAGRVSGLGLVASAGVSKPVALPGHWMVY